MAKTVSTPGTYNVDAVALFDGKVIFKGPGVFNVNVGLIALSNYTIEAKDGAVVNFNADFSAGALPHLDINGDSTISFDEDYSLFSATTVRFTGGGGGTVILPPGQTFGDRLPRVVNFKPTDNIDFNSPYDAGDKIVYQPTGTDIGNLTLKDSSGDVLGTVKLVGSYMQSDFTLGQGPDGTAEIINTACFLRGTMIATADGEVAVETLRAGDMIKTLDNGLKPVKAVQLRSLVKDEEVASARFRPVRFAAGSLGEGLPVRDLYVSPDHSMYLDGALVPAHLLVDGTSITQPANDRQIDYFHVEIEPQDIILAEGAATESYLDIGNRGHFVRPGVVSLFAETDPKTWEDACAPLVLAGPRLARIKAALAARSGRLELPSAA